MEQTLDLAESALAEAYAELAVAPPPRELSRQTPLRTPRLKPRTKVAVSVLIPVYNELATIREIVRRVREAGQHDEIIIVDDCSTDGTRDVLIELDRAEDIRVIMHGYNRGKGAALRTALEHSRGDVVLIQDADLEYSPTDYAKMLAPIAAGEADVVYGSRFLAGDKQDPSWLHRLGNRCLTALSNLTTGGRLTDMETCYKVFRRDALRGMRLRENRFGFEPELTAKLARRRCRIAEVPIAYQPRSAQQGKKIGVRDGLQAIWCILRYAWVD